MAKTYTISDLFFTSWNELSGKTIADVYALHLRAQTLEKDSRDYGFILIEILRRLKKNPRLVDKLNVDQAVDIYNDLTFLDKPWYHFPSLRSSAPLRLSGKKLETPDEKMARHTFDHFIYADNEYSSYVVTQDVRHLKRLVATIYQREFDKEDVQPIEKALHLQLKPWQLNLVFFTFMHVREFVMKRCKTLLPPAAQKADDEAPDSPRATGALWLKIKHRLAETPAFQGYDVAGAANMYATLDYLEDLAQIKEQKR
jgi:hypothetical protein